PTRLITDPEQIARIAVERRAKPSVVPGHVKLTLTLDLPRSLAEQLTTRAMRAGKSLEALVLDVLKGLASLALILLLSACCAASPDWIQSTLVTADVTGVWRGTVQTSAVTLELEQRGPRVSGTFKMGTGYVGPLDGTVEGDVFRFAMNFKDLKGELTVTGDE